MKTIGLIGGMSWESSIVYYRIINQLVRERLGGLHSASCVMYSFDFDRIVRLQREGNWPEATQCMVDAAHAVERAGAEVIVICTNTMHKMFEQVQQASRVPLIHIADPTADRIRHAGLRTVGLLATQFTMEQDFYIGRLASAHKLEVLTPGQGERKSIHEIIFGELCRGVVRDDSRQQAREMIQGLARRGAEGVILGCTELGLLIDQADSELPLFDTTLIHAESAAEWALNGHA
jgi:aspartate racemase